MPYYQKCEDEVSKREIKDILTSSDQILLAADSPHCKAKKFGSPSAILATRNPTNKPTMKTQSWI
jgi:hypothetical protein